MNWEIEWGTRLRHSITDADNNGHTNKSNIVNVQIIKSKNFETKL
jgi:hypothetical protein